MAFRFWLSDFGFSICAFGGAIALGLNQPDKRYRMLGLIDPDEQTVLVYLPPEQVKVFDQSTAQLPMPLFAAGIHLTVGELCGWLIVRPPQS